MTVRMSIVVLNYNYARFLRESVDSALGQSHPDVEVVVVDDGSGDDSAAAISDYGDRVTAVLKPNGGQGSAMNAGFAASSGQVVLFLDADDFLAGDVASQLAETFTARPDTAWVMFRLAMVDGASRPLGRIRPQRLGVMPDGDLRAHVARFRCFHWQPTSGNAFARWALAEVLPMPEQDYRISADAYLASVVPLCGPVRSLDIVGGSYRLHGDNAFSAGAVDARYFRDQVNRQVVNHGHALAVARRLGVELPVDVRAPADAAFLGFRLSSLVLDPPQHPFPDDRRRRLAGAGVRASLGNPELTWANRLRRAAWFAACGAATDRQATRLVQRWSPDTVARRARLVAAVNRREAAG